MIQKKVARVPLKFIYIAILNSDCKNNSSFNNSSKFSAIFLLDDNRIKTKEKDSIRFLKNWTFLHKMSHWKSFFSFFHVNTTYVSKWVLKENYLNCNANNMNFIPSNFPKNSFLTQFLLEFFSRSSEFAW